VCIELNILLSLLADSPGEWLCDGWSSIEEAKLSYVAAHSNEDDSGAGEDTDDEPSGDGERDEYAGEESDAHVKDIRLPMTFVHSPAWIAGNVADCLALRRKFGAISFFTTLTCNPKWPEILAELEPGQNAQDRPDVVVRVFRRRLAAFLKQHEAIFGPDRYTIQVIEFQKRGLPHAHLAIALKHVPQSVDDLDKFLSAEVPDEPGHLRDAVLQNMVHSHRPGQYHRCGWTLDGGKCQYGFPKPLLEVSKISDDGKQYMCDETCA
jgi:hypothetical protein